MLLIYTTLYDFPKRTPVQGVSPCLTWDEFSVGEAKTVDNTNEMFYFIIITSFFENWIYEVATRSTCCVGIQALTCRLFRRIQGGSTKK